MFNAKFVNHPEMNAFVNSIIAGLQYMADKDAQPDEIERITKMLQEVDTEIWEIVDYMEGEYEIVNR